ncbi:hypothetical protein Ciccas_009115 [Cichlidogyrus casuarinus]|uniref:Uncharacterized protein n=1 Tax=Cichlidogyrus casuarinus TaxID=1844966 RepID=A0ABD2PXZ0_9PLAT
MISGITFRLKQIVPKVCELPEGFQLLRDKKYDYEYSFGIEFETNDQTLPEKICALPKNPKSFSNSVIQPIKFQPNNIEKCNTKSEKDGNSSLLKDFDSCLQLGEDPFHSVELGSVNELEELSQVLHTSNSRMSSSQRINSLIDRIRSSDLDMTTRKQLQDGNTLLKLSQTLNFLCDVEGMQDDLVLAALSKYPLDSDKAISFCRLLREFSQFGYSVDQIYHCARSIGDRMEPHLVKNALLRMET